MVRLVLRKMEVGRFKYLELEELHFLNDSKKKGSFLQIFVLLGFLPYFAF